MSVPPPDRSGAATAESPFTLANFLTTARKHLTLFLVCWAVVFAAMVFWTVGQKRVYRAQALLRLDADPPRPLGAKVELISHPGAYWNHREFFATEYRVMTSMRVAMAVVRTLGLNADPAFMHSPPGKSFKLPTVEEAATVLVSRLSVEPIKESSLTLLNYEDTDPKRSQIILNAVVRTYLSQNMEGATNVSSTALDWLNGQLSKLKTDLNDSEQALTDFRQKNNVLSISLEDRHNIISSQLEQLSKEVTTLEVRRSEAAAKSAELNKIESGPQSAGHPDLLASIVLNKLRTDYDDQKQRLEELLAVYDVGNPKVVGLKDRLKETDLAIRKEIDNIKAAASSDVRKLDRQIADLKKKDLEIQKQAHELQAFEVPYNQLNRTKLNNEKIYGLVLERARETDLTRMMNLNNIRVIDEALEPKIPVRPNVPLNLAIGALLGLFLGLGVVLTRELADQSLKTPADVETILGVTCLGLLPEIATNNKAGYRYGGRRRRQTATPIAALSDRDLCVAANPEGGVAEAARAVRTNLAFMSPDRPYHSLLVTSAVPEEGKTTVACSIATVLAQSGLRVLLVDTDLRRPRLHRTFKVPNDVGVSMAVSGQLPLDECIRETAIPNLQLLTSGPIPPNPSELMESARFRDLIRTIQGRFDRIVFDSAPLLPVTDSAILSRLTDGVVLVVRGFRTHRSATRQAIRILRDVKAQLVGVLLNAIDLGRYDYRNYHYYYARDGYASNPNDSAN